MIPTFYRFMDKGTSNLGVLIAYPISGFIASIVARLLASDGDFTLSGKEMKQSVAFLLMYFVFSLVFFMIPRVFIG